MHMQVDKHMQYSVYGNGNENGNLTIKYVVQLYHIPENVDAHVLKGNQYDTGMLLYLTCPGREMYILLLRAQWWFPNSSWKLYCAVMALLTL